MDDPLPGTGSPRRRLRRVMASGSAAVAGLAAAGTASAHGGALTEFDAPLPLEFLFAGAGVTVALTALLLAVAGERPAGSRPVVRLPVPVERLERAVGAVFLALVASAVVAGVTGRQVAASNAATVFVWPVWLKGLAVVAVIAGSPWRVLSPWRTIYDGLCRLEGDRIAARRYPRGLGNWPALVGFVLLVGVLENLTTVPRNPAMTAGLVAALTTVMLAGGLAFGPTWFERADPLAALYRLLGRTAPVRVERHSDGDGLLVSLRAPWRDTARPVADWALVTFAIAAVYTVSFDGFIETPEYQAVLFTVRDVTGLGPQVSVLLYLLGLAGFVAVFAATARLAGRLGRFGTASLAFAPTVVPIAAAYEIAHNYPYVARNLGRLPATVGLEPLAPLAWLSLPLFWGSQVVLIVLGHVVAVVAAHQVATARTDSRRRALWVHAPVVVLMVGYTVLSLWIVSRPIV